MVTIFRKQVVRSLITACQLARKGKYTDSKQWLGRAYGIESMSPHPEDDNLLDKIHEVELVIERQFRIYAEAEGL